MWQRLAVLIQKLGLGESDGEHCLPNYQAVFLVVIGGLALLKFLGYM